VSVQSREQNLILNGGVTAPVRQNNGRVMMDTDPEKTEKLLAKGWVIRVGNELHITEAGRRAIRRGIVPPPTPDKMDAPIDSVRARSKVGIKKFKKRRR
jgi:hypothetical protein